MNTPTSDTGACPHMASFANDYLNHVANLLRSLDREAVAAFLGLLMDARRRGARIFFVGNGGSAATASHFANDLALGTRAWEKPFRAISLADNVPTVTAIANDYGYEYIFSLQLKVLMQPGDLVVAISASGNSPNVVRAIRHANENQGISIALVGFDGGELKRTAAHCVHLETAKDEYGPVEDIHMVIDHLAASYLLRACGEETRATRGVA